MENCERNRRRKMRRALAQAHADRNSRFYAIPTLGPWQMITEYSVLDYRVIDPRNFPTQTLTKVSVSTESMKHCCWVASCIAPNNGLVGVRDRCFRTPYTLHYHLPGSFKLDSATHLSLLDMHTVAAIQPSYDGTSIVLLLTTQNYFTLRLCNLPWPLPRTNLIPYDPKLIGMIDYGHYTELRMFRMWNFVCLPSGHHYAMIHGEVLVICSKTECLQYFDLTTYNIDTRMCYTLDLTFEEGISSKSRLFCYFFDAVLILNFNIEKWRVQHIGELRHISLPRVLIRRLQTEDDAYFAYDWLTSKGLLLNTQCEVVRELDSNRRNDTSTHTHVTHDGRALITLSRNGIDVYSVQ
jgi:hypothetical protein